jgi:hypothetical protein
VSLINYRWIKKDAFFAKVFSVDVDIC